MYPTSICYAEVVNHLCLKDKSCLQILWFLAGAGHFPKQLCSATIREYEFLQPPRNLHVQETDCQEPGIMMGRGYAAAAVTIAGPRRLDPRANHLHSSEPEQRLRRRTFV